MQTAAPAEALKPPRLHVKGLHLDTEGSCGLKNRAPRPRAMNEKDRHGRFLARFQCSSGVENISKASESKRAEPTDVHGPLDAAGIGPASA